MPAQTPPEKLAQSLILLKELQEGGVVAIRSVDLTRVHRERLLQNGFLQEVMKGWYISTRPDETRGESTAWYASYWNFCAAYLDDRFKSEWCLSPEQSLLLHSGNWTVPSQLLVRSSQGSNNIIQLPHGTSLLDAQYNMPAKNNIEVINGIRVFSISAALAACSEKFFQQHFIDAQAILLIIDDASEMLRILLAGGHSTVAGRLAGAFRHVGKENLAENIVKTMKAAGYDVRENDPFTDSIEETSFGLARSPYVQRLQIMWQEMRKQVMANFPVVPKRSLDLEAYLNSVDEKYVTDAYHSLSIEGYRVSAELIERVSTGQWNPDTNINDAEHRNALAVRGYYQAFQRVKESIGQVLQSKNPSKVVRDQHAGWYLELFGPSVTAGILKVEDLAGYRNGPVYIRRSMHVPPNKDAVRDLMPAFFDLLQQESVAEVRVVLGHFFFVYIHPYFDGNGRMGRFLMNVMCAAGNYSWLVIPVELRDQYMAALEDASVKQNIVPLVKFIGNLVLKNEMPSE